MFHLGPYKRHSYHTDLKLMFLFGREKELPADMIGQIHRSNIWRWKQESKQRYVGCELSAIAQEKMKVLHQFAGHTKAQKVFEAYLKMEDTIKGVFQKVKGFRQNLLEHKEVIVNSIDQLKDSIPVEEAVRLWGISRSTFQNWKRKVSFSCDSSAIQYCVRHFPNQLTKRELGTIKRMLTDPALLIWPITSIHWMAKRSGEVYASLSTWYNYARLLEIKRPRPQSRRKKHKKGIRAATLDQFWHLPLPAGRRRCNGIHL